MYQLYCLDAQERALQPDIQYGEEDKDIWSESQRRIDRFEYLIIMYQIVCDCSNELRVFKITSEEVFWKVNKYLLNYMNAVYSLKEYLSRYGLENETNEHKQSTFFSVMDDAYKECRWFLFACEYRNRIIHQSNFLKDYDPKTGVPFICLDEFIDLQKNQLDIAIRKNIKKKSIDLKKAFIEWLHELEPKCQLEEKTKMHMLTIYSFTDSIDKEINSIMSKTFKKIFDEEIIESLDTIFKFIYRKEKQYYNTAIYSNDSSYRFYPNSTIETLLIHMKRIFGSEYEVTSELIKYLKAKSYDFIFQTKSMIDL